MAVKELKNKYNTVKEAAPKSEELAKDPFESYNMDIAPWNRVKPGVEKTNRVNEPSLGIKQTYVSKLLEICIDKGWSEPGYKLVPRHPKNGNPVYGCQVKVGPEHSFSSYPEESYLPNDAKENAARKACERLMEIEMEQSRNGLRITTDYNLIHRRVYEVTTKRWTYY